MDNIIEPTLDYNFSNLQLSTPNSLAGGSYFTKMFINSKPIYIQTPKSLTKQGFIKSSKKMYADLMFDNTDSLFINWLENLESKCQSIIASKGTEWFESPLETTDIESAFTSPIKVYKSGKFYLVRVNVKPNIKIYDDKNEIINSEHITPDLFMISILEIQGIKFTSRNFQIEMELKQCMIVSPDPFLDTCFIKRPNIKQEVKNADVNDTKHLVSLNQEDIPNSFFQEKEKDKEKEKEKEKDKEKEKEKQHNINYSNHISDDFCEFNLDIAADTPTITLNKPNQVYYNLYKSAKEKAKIAKKEAIIAYLEAKNIKNTYLLDDTNDSDSDFDIENIENYSDFELEKEL